METINYLSSLTLPHHTADFDYFRIPPEKWRLCLTRLHQTGINTLTLTIPWQFHQPAPNTLDLDSRPQKNLPALLKLCVALKFRCIVKSGPVATEHGLLNQGLPHWLTAPVDIFDTEFSKAVTIWLDAVSRGLSGYQWPDGPIVALSLDFGEGGSPNAPVSDRATEVRWPIWLRKRYHGIDALNTAYDSTYRTVNEVVFPQNLSETNDNLPAADAREFLQELRQDTQRKFETLLRDAGWLLPIYPFDSGSLPPLQDYTADSAANFAAEAIVNWQQPIQVEPDPPDVGVAPGWADTAPIRADGSLRRSYYKLRHLTRPQWQHLANAEITTFTFDGGGLVTATQDTLLKIDLPKGSRPKAFTLYFTGEIRENTEVKAWRGKLKGNFLLEDASGQIDAILYLDDPTAPLANMPSGYLQQLLNIQRETLLHGAGQAAKLSDSLSVMPSDGGDISGTSSEKKSRPASPPRTITEARRGLQNAESALKKAMAAIGGLEIGFDSIINREQLETAEPSAPPVAISAVSFEGRARELLLETAEVCANVAARLKTAADTPAAAASTQMTLAEYQQDYDAAVQAAHSARAALLPIIARLRLDFAAEQLPLVAWRVHQQVVSLSETLRWGVLRR